MTRIIIFTGKGGVGKTSVAAAHAWRSAKEGADTLLVSTDMAHNLSDLFCQRIGREPVTIAPHLDALELDPEYIMQQGYTDLLRAINGMLSSVATQEMQDLVMMPGQEELFSLLMLLDIYEGGRYQRIIVDCAPTGETLALLKFPELLSWYMERFFPIEKIAMRILSPISKKLFKLELPDERAMSDMERLYSRLLTLQEVLKDDQVTSVRLVTLAEKMVVEETKRSYMYLNLYGYQVDGVYINRILPDDVANPYFDQWQQIQKKYIAELEAVFATIPIVQLPWYEVDICGPAAIERVCNEVLTDPELFFVRQHLEHERYQRTEEGYLLTLYVPIVEKAQMDMYLSGTDIIIRIGNFKRSIPLPNVLRQAEITSAKLEHGRLQITLSKEVCYES